MIKISKKVKKIEPSVTLTITSKAKQLIKEGKDVVLFGAGEPDFKTPENIKKAAKKAIDENYSYYTPVAGTIELKKAIQKKFLKDNNLHYELNQIIAGTGGKQILFNAFQAILNPNDEVILTNPYWVSYLEQIKFAGGKPIIVNTDKNFKVKASEIKKAITQKTKIILLNSPNNPSGATIDLKELKKIANLAIKHDLIIFSDEVYEPFVYEGKHYSIAALGKQIFERTLTINAISKSYSMTGWRLGYCAGPKEIISAMSKIQSHSTSNPSSISQQAAIEALNGQKTSIKKMRQAFKKRRNTMVKLLNEIKGIHCTKPEGAFYCFPNIKKTGLTSTEFAKKLLNEALVAVIPGKAFGNDECIRLSYATSEQQIKKGIKRIKKWVMIEKTKLT